MSLLLLTVTLRGVSNKHCLLPLFSFRIKAMAQKRQNDVSFNPDGRRKCRVFKGKNGFIKALAPKSMQEKKFNMRLWIRKIILSLWSLFGITRQSLAVTFGTLRIVYPIHKLMIDTYFPLQDSIQKILLSLSTHLMSSHRIHSKRRVLLMYQLFTRLLLREFHNQLGGAWAFVMRDIIFRLLHLVKEVRNMKRYASIMLLSLQVDVIILKFECGGIMHPKDA